MPQFDLKQKLEYILVEEGYKINHSIVPDYFTWQPDVLAEKNNEAIAFLIKLTESIPETLVQRISRMKRGKLNLKSIILFSKKPSSKTIKLIEFYGLEAKVIEKNRLKDVTSIKTKEKPAVLIKASKPKRKLKPSRVDIFISSHQIINERKIAEEEIDTIRSAHRFPIFPILVEDDQRYNIKKKKECIDRNMDESELFLAVIAEEYRTDVNYEIKKSFKCFDPKEEIYIFVKVIENRPKKSTNLIEWIKKQDSVKLLEYTDDKDFKVKIVRAVMSKINSICKTLKINLIE